MCVEDERMKFCMNGPRATFKNRIFISSGLAVNLATCAALATGESLLHKNMFGTSGLKQWKR